MLLNASVAVDGQGVAMNLYRVAVDQDVTLDQGQVDVESFGISCQCSCQIASGDVRQTAPSYSSRRPHDEHLVPVVRIMHLRMVPAESAFAYMESTRAYIEQHGKPVAFYSNKHSVFRVHTASSKRSDGMTQFGRALHDLNIEIICANSAPAKGRIERCHQTLQDRLVKEMRLAGINDVETANAFLPSFIERHNARFAKEPLNPKNLHRPSADHESLDDALCWREERAVSSALSLHYNKVIFILDPNPMSRSLARKKVTVCDYPDGRLEVRHDGVSLPYRIFDKFRQVHQAQVLDPKRLGAALDMAKKLQASGPEGRRNNTPNRRGQDQNVFIMPNGPPKRSLDRSAGTLI